MTERESLYIFFLILSKIKEREEQKKMNTTTIDPINYLKRTNKKEVFELVNTYKKHYIGDFKLFNTFNKAKKEAFKRMKNNKELFYVKINRYFKGLDGHIYYDGAKNWRVIETK